MDKKILEIVLQARDLASAQLRNAFNSISKSSKEAERSVSGFGKTLRDIGKIAAGIGLYRLAEEGFRFAKSMVAAGIETASFYENAKIQLETFLKDSAKAQKLLDQIKKDAMKTPFDTRALVEGVSLLISAGEDAEEARKTVLALGNAILAVGKGNAELRRMAVNLQQIKALGKATAMDIRQFAMVGINIYSLLNQKQKEHVKRVAGEQTKAYKKAAEAIMKYSNRIQEMKLRLKELEEAGKGNTSTALRLKNRINEYTLKLKEAQAEASKYAGKIITIAEKEGKVEATYEDIKRALIEAQKQGGMYYGAMERAAGSYEQRLSNMKEALDVFFADLLTKTGAFDLLKESMRVFTDFLNNNKDTIIGFILAVGNGIQKLINIFQAVGNFLMTIFKPAWDGLKESFQTMQPYLNQLQAALRPLLPLFKFIATVIGAVLAGAITLLISLLIGTITAFSKALGSFVQFITGIIQLISGFWTIILGIFTLNFDLIKQGWENLKNGIINIITGLINYVINLIKGFVEGIINFFKTLYHTLVGGSIIPDMVNAMISWFKKLFNIGKVIFNAIKTFLIGLWKKISATVKGIVESFVNNLISKFTWLYNSLKGVKDKLLGLFKSLAKGITGALKSIKFPHISLGEGSINIMGREIKYPKINIDWYQQGGWVKKTGLAMLHAGEFVLSRDMLRGLQPIPQSIGDTFNQRIIVNANISSDVDIYDLSYKLGWLLRNG